MKRMPLWAGLIAGLTLFTTGASAQIDKVGNVQPYAYASGSHDNTGEDSLLVDRKVVRFPKASFLRLEFAKVKLGADSFLEVISLQDRDSQIFDADSIQQSGVFSAFFNGDAVEVSLWAAPGTKDNRYSIVSADVGAVQPNVSPMTLCGSDNRTKSSDKRVARLLFRKGTGTYVCTAFLINPTNAFASAGHCFSGGATAHVAQFNVPYSTSTGLMKNPSSIYQYNWTGTRQYQDGGVGKDWAVFTTNINATTKKHAGVAQGTYFRFWTSVPPKNTVIRLTGHGADTTPRTYNFIQQTSTGTVYNLTSTAIYHRIDSEGGNSGAPLDWNGWAVGIHTHGGCTSSTSSYNKGTRFDYAPFASARRSLAGHRPDLYAQSISAPSSMTAGSTISVTSRIFNIGLWPSSGVTSSYYLSTNSVISTADTLLRSWTTPGLAPSLSHTYSGSISVSATYPTASRWIGVFADRTFSLAESNEANNTLARALRINGRPDLVISYLLPSTSLLTPSRAFTLRSTTKNQGTGSSGVSATGLYFSSNSFISTGDYLLRTFNVAGLTPNGSYTYTAACTAPSSLSSTTCYLGGLADRTRTVSESYETNNTRAYAIRCLGAAPDLRPRSLIASKTSFYPSDRVTLTGSVMNIGTATAGPSNTGYYLSTNSTISSADTLLYAFTAPTLIRNAYYTRSGVVTIPASTRPGNCYFGIFADRTSSISELNEANNTLALAARCLGLQDLVISNMTVPSAMAAGSSYTVSTWTKNTGNATVASSRTGLFLSSNTVISTADEYLGGHNTGTLLPGATKYYASRITLPYCTSTGTWYVGAYADYTQTVSERTETNNTLYRTTRATHYTGSLRYLLWKTYVGQPATSPTSATFKASTGGYNRLCLVAPKLANHWYVLVWSASPSTFRLDGLSSFSLSLLNSAVFPVWLGRVNAVGQASSSLAFRVPRSSISSGFTAYTHQFWFTPTFSGFVGGGSNRLQTIVTR